MSNIGKAMKNFSTTSACLCSIYRRYSSCSRIVAPRSRTSSIWSSWTTRLKGSATIPSRKDCCISSWCSRTLEWKGYGASQLRAISKQLIRGFCCLTITKWGRITTRLSLHGMSSIALIGSLERRACALIPTIKRRSSVNTYERSLKPLTSSHSIPTRNIAKKT